MAISCGPKKNRKKKHRKHSVIDKQLKDNLWIQNKSTKIDTYVYKDTLQ